MLETDDFAMLKKKALVAALCAALLGAGVTGGVPPAPAGEAPPLEGAFADNFTFLTPSVPAPREAFHDLSGNPVRLADFKGQVVLLNFWATWCATCIREMPSLDQLQAGLGRKGLSVVAVSIDGAGAKAIVPFAERLKLGPQLLAREADQGPGPAGLPGRRGEALCVAELAHGRIKSARPAQSKLPSPFDRLRVRPTAHNNLTLSFLIPSLSRDEA